VIDRLFPQRLGHGPGETGDDQAPRALTDRTCFERRLGQVRKALKTEAVLSIHEQPTQA